MKIIDFPEPVTFKIPTTQGDQEFTVPFIEFLKTAMAGHEVFKTGPEMARKYGQIMDVIEAVNGEKEIRFGPSDYDLVAAAVKTAGWIHPDANRAYIPFYDAVEKARDVTTEAKKKLQAAEEKAVEEK